MKNYFSQKCPHCGNMMYISTSSKKVVCLNCDKEFEIDKDLLKKFNEEKEEKLEKSKKRKKNNKKFDTSVLFVILSIFVLFGLIFSLIKNVEKVGNKDIKISYSSHYFRNEKLILEDVIKKLKKNGFTNIQYEAVYDVGFLSKYKEMQVEKVLINDSEIYTKNDRFPKDSKIIIYYHDEIEKNPKKNIPNYYGTFIGDDRSIIMIGKDESVYYFKGTSMYDKEVICNEENNKIVLDVKSLGYKLYFDKKSNYDYDFEVKSTNENWNTEKFIKYSDEVDYTKYDMDKIITSSKALERMKTEVVKKELQNDGYTNVVLVPQYDVYFGILVDAGDIEKISINGETQFDSYLGYSKNSIIKIYYHEESSKDPEKVKEEKETTRETNKVNKNSEETKRIISTTSVASKNTKGKIKLESNKMTKKRGVFDDPDVIMHKFIDSMCEQQYKYGYKISGLSVNEISDGVIDGVCILSVKNLSGIWGNYTLHCVADFNKEKLLTWDVK